MGSGMVSIRPDPNHPSLPQSGGIAGITQGNPVPISATVNEITFPTVEGPDWSQTLTGSSSSGPVLDPTPAWLGYLRPPGTTMTVRCTWSFANNSTPAPPCVPSASPPGGLSTFQVQSAVANNPSATVTATAPSCYKLIGGGVRSDSQGNGRNLPHARGHLPRRPAAQLPRAGRAPQRITSILIRRR